jgi:hypothetical protein
MPKKLILDADEKLWKRILRYKITHSFKNNNQTVISLLKKALRREHGKCNP